MFSKNNIICEIAEIITEIPKAGGIAPRLGDYAYFGESKPQIIISEEKYDYERYPNLSEEDNVYLQSGFMFYAKLLKFDGFHLHSSAVEFEGKAYLFSGPCGTGKSTHTRLWQKVFGEEAKVFNDDKPAIRKVDGVWYAYGTPWCGKDGININMKVPLGGICFLKQAKENKIRRLGSREALEKILSQTFHKFKRLERLDKMLFLIGQIVEEIPVYEFENLPIEDSARLSYETLKEAAKEAGL